MNVKCKIVEVGCPDYKENKKEYWGFYDKSEKRVTMIQPSWFQFFTCFTYGPKSAEDKGRGYCVRLEVGRSKIRS